MNHSKKEKGQGLVEYALILVLVGIVVIASLMILGPTIGSVFSNINNSLSGLGVGTVDDGVGDNDDHHGHINSFDQTP